MILGKSKKRKRTALRFQQAKKAKRSNDRGKARVADPYDVALLESAGICYPAAEARLAEDTTLFPGVNACAVCARPEGEVRGEDCAACQRVWYCSAACFDQDAPAHAAVCHALVRVADDEKAVGRAPPLPPACPPAGVRALKGFSWHEVLRAEESAELRRWWSEALSYPATLAACFSSVPALAALLQSDAADTVDTADTGKRGGSGDDSGDGGGGGGGDGGGDGGGGDGGDGGGGGGGGGGDVHVHVVGASEAEVGQDPVRVWGWFAGMLQRASPRSDPPTTKAALHLWMVGPDMPEALAGTALPPLAPPALGDVLSVVVHFERALYHDFAGTAKEPSAIFSFNPGFCVASYDWAPSLDAMRRASDGTLPLVVATNTAVECKQECSLLVKKKVIAKGAAKALRNPVAPLLLRQSGTLANDVYSKSTWVYSANVLASTGRSSS